MTRTGISLLFWALAIMLSLTAHVALVIIIERGTEPDPVPMTEEIHTRIDMSALDVPSQRAEAQDAEGELTESSEASGERLGVRDVPTSQARPVALPGQEVAALAATTQVTRPAAAQGAATPATSSGGDRLAAATLAAPSLATSEAPTTPVAPVAIPNAVAAAAPTPRGDAIATVQPESATLAAATTEAPVLAAAAVAPSTIAAAEPPADTMIAAESRGPVTNAVPPPSLTMAAAAVPTETLPGARASGTDLAPVAAATARLPTVAAATARLPTVAAGGARVDPARPAAIPAAARAADSTVLIATENAAPTVTAQPPPATLMAAASVPTETLPGARASGTDLAPVAAATALLATVAPGGARIVPAKPAALPAVARAADATAVIATVSTPPAVSARPPPATLMASVAAPAESLATARAKTQQVASLRAAPEPVATLDSASPGLSVPAALAVPQATELASSATSDLAGFVAPTSAASASVVANAALAWSGSAKTVLDEQSLAAIQSFMQPGDIAGSAAHAGSVRDGIGAALAQFPCSRLQAAFQPETGGLEIRGHVPTPDMRTAVVGMLENTVGGSIPVGGSVLVLPQPQCGVLDVVERLGLPQSVDQAGDPLVIGEEAQARIERHEEGERLTLPLKGAEYDAYIYVDYYDADGNVIHLMPNELGTDNRIEANEFFKIGDDESGLKLTIAPPFGQDIAVILATTSPLYDGSLPLIERADDYLPWLHARVAAFSAADPEFRGEWVYHFVLTGPVGAFANR